MQRDEQAIAQLRQVVQMLLQQGCDGQKISELTVSGVGCQVSGVGCRVSGVGCRVSGVRG